MILNEICTLSVNTDTIVGILCLFIAFLKSMAKLSAILSF